MTSGTFRSVFNHCTSDAAGMEELYFDNLLEGTSKVYLKALGSLYSRNWRVVIQPVATC